MSPLNASVTEIVVKFGALLHVKKTRRRPDAAPASWGGTLENALRSAVRGDVLVHFPAKSAGPSPGLRNHSHNVGNRCVPGLLSDERSKDER